MLKIKICHENMSMKEWTHDSILDYDYDAEM